MTIKTIYIDGNDKDLSMMNQGVAKIKKSKKKEVTIDNNQSDEKSNISKKIEVASIVEKYSNKKYFNDTISSKLSKIKENPVGKEKSSIDISLKSLDKMSNLDILSCKQSNDNKSLVQQYFQKKTINGEKSSISNINSFFSQKLKKLDTISEDKCVEKSIKSIDTKKDEIKIDEWEKKQKIEMEKIQQIREDILKEKNEITRERELLKDELNKKQQEMDRDYNLKIELEKKRIKEKEREIENEKNDLNNIREIDNRNREHINKQKKELNKYREKIQRVLSKNRSYRRQNNKKDNDNKKNNDNKRNTDNQKNNDNQKNKDKSRLRLKNISLKNNNNVDDFYTKSISISINDLKNPVNIVNKKKLEKDKIKQLLYKNNIIKHLDTPDDIIEHIYNMTDMRLLK